MSYYKTIDGKKYDGELIELKEKLTNNQASKSVDVITSTIQKIILLLLLFFFNGIYSQQIAYVTELSTDQREDFFSFVVMEYGSTFPGKLNRFSSANENWVLTPGDQFQDFKIKYNDNYSSFHALTNGFPYKLNGYNDVELSIDENSIYLKKPFEAGQSVYWTLEHSRLQDGIISKSVKHHLIATAVFGTAGFSVAGPPGAFLGGLIGYVGATFYDGFANIPENDLKDNSYYSLKIADDDGDLFVERYHKTRNPVFEGIFDSNYKRTTIWSSSDQRYLAHDFDTLEEYLEYILGLELTNTLSISNFNDFHLMLINENFFLFNGNVYNINNLYGFFDDNSISISPVNSLRNDINVDHVYTLSASGTIVVKDFESNIIDEIGSECIKFPTGEDHSTSLDEENGDIIVTSTSRKLFTRTNHTTKCEFPSEGVSSLGNQKLIQHNQTPGNNELTYLISSDKKNITIIHDRQLKVINKDDFNGNFITSPSVQVLDLN